MTGKIPKSRRCIRPSDTLVIDSDNGFSNTGGNYKLWATPHISVAAVLNFSLTALME